MNISTTVDIYITYLAASIAGNPAPAGLSYSTLNTGSDPQSITSFPININNANTDITKIITVYFATPITITGASQYFIANSSNIIFDGQNNTVTISSVTNYPGLIQNGTVDVNGFSNITVKNINTQSTGTGTATLFSTFVGVNGSTVPIAGGWICQLYFSKGVNNNISNCYNTANITNGGGGICGAYCYATISDCYNTGTVGASGNSFNGGICGAFCAATISNCYNTGNVTGTRSGGICGGYANGAKISNCYNADDLSGTSGGGICGGNLYSVSIKNCYYICTASGNKLPYGMNVSSVSYTTPPITEGNAFSNSSWSTYTAKTALIGWPVNSEVNPIGTTWTIIGTDKPFLLSSFNTAIYNPNNSDYYNQLSLSSGASILNNYNFQFISINKITSGVESNYPAGNNIVINTSRNTSNDTSRVGGTITFASGLNADQNVNEFIVYVLASNNFNSNAPSNYVINKFTATVEYEQVDADVSCFNYDTKILHLNSYLEEEYIPIQHLREGDLVKTYLHEYKAIKKIGKGKLLNNPTNSAHCMFKMEKTETNGLIEDLIITGGHSIMVDELTEYQANLQESMQFNEAIDNKQLLLACVSSDFQAIQNNYVYTYYHFILENDGDIEKRYGVYANGIILETPPEHGYNRANLTPL